MVTAVYRTGWSRVWAAPWLALPPPGRIIARIAATAWIIRFHMVFRAQSTMSASLLVRPYCSVAGQQQPAAASQRRAPTSILQTTRRQQLQGAIGAALLPLVGPATAAAAAEDASGSGQRAETARLEAAYDGYAATYDDLDGGAAAEQLGFPALRAALLAQARGDVLETAVGTGLNLPFYQAAALTSLTAVDLSRGMLSQAARRAAQLGLADRLRLQLVQADVELLQAALGGRQFDTGAMVPASVRLLLQLQSNAKQQLGLLASLLSPRSRPPHNWPPTHPPT